MITKNIQMKSLLLFTAVISLAGCAHQEYTPQISKQPLETALVTAAQNTKGSTQTDFPSSIQENNGKVSFNAPIILGEGVDISKLTVNSVSYKTINKDNVYNHLFQGVEIVNSQKGDAGGTDSYEGSKEETLVVNESGITFFSDKARSVLRAFNPSRQSDRYNVEKYNSNKDFDFSTKAEALKQINSELAQFGIDLGNNYGYQCYSLDYNTMKLEEYAIDKDGNENKSIYKKNWNEDDNCYYFCIWQTCENLSVAYNTHMDIKGGDAPIQVIYSKRGIEYLTAQAPMSFTSSSSAVQLAALDKVKKCVSDRFNTIDTNAAYTVEGMELTHMVRSDINNNYSISPSWILDIVSKDNSSSAPYRFKIAVDAQTAEDITQ